MSQLSDKNINVNFVRQKVLQNIENQIHFYISVQSYNNFDETDELTVSHESLVNRNKLLYL